MNPSPPPDIWCNPPPPGTIPPELPDSKKEVRSIDKIDPYLKNPEYERRSSERRHRHKRRRSRSRHRHRRRHHSSSRSRSRSRRRHHRRHSRSRSRRRSHKRSRRSRSRRRSHSPKKHDPIEEPPVKEEEEDDDDDDEEEEPVKENAFKNDGSFMEMFKKMQEEQMAKEAEKANAIEEQNRIPAFGKRRGGKVLKTGMVQKSKNLSQEEMDSNAQDAWTLYMKEVKRYKEACCDEDSKTRLLVK